MKPASSGCFSRRRLDRVGPQLRVGQHLVARLIERPGQLRQIRGRDPVLRQKTPARVIGDQVAVAIESPSA